jgi:hypothetical protein
MDKLDQMFHSLVNVTTYRYVYSKRKSLYSKSSMSKVLTKPLISKLQSHVIIMPARVY